MIRIATLLCVLVAALSVDAAAQQAADPRTTQALARAQSLLRQLGEQKQQIEIENAQLKATEGNLRKRLERAQWQLDDGAAALAASAQSHTRASAKIARLEETVAARNDKLREAVDKYRQTRELLEQALTEKEALAGSLASTQSELADAERKNLELYTDAREILRLYKNKSRLAGVIQDEPLTGIKNVSVESLIEKYEYELYDHVRDDNLVQARDKKRESPLFDK